MSKEVTKPTDFDRASFDESLRSWQDKQQGKEWVLSGLLEGSEDSKEQNEAHEEAWPTNACLIANVSVLATGIATALFGGSDFSNDVFTRLMYSATEVRILQTSHHLVPGAWIALQRCTFMYALALARAAHATEHRVGMSRCVARSATRANARACSNSAACQPSTYVCAQLALLCFDHARRLVCDDVGHTVLATCTPGLGPRLTASQHQSKLC